MIREHLPPCYFAALISVCLTVGMGTGSGAATSVGVEGVLARSQTALDALPAEAIPLFKQYCFECHSDKKSKGQINLERLALAPDFAGRFKQWEKIATVLEKNEMPPEDEPQPDGHQRRQLIAGVQHGLEGFVRRTAGDPGRIALRQLTSAEYAYTIQDLTGLDLGLERSFVSDAVGGEGFSNVGDVQFIQESALERYLEAAKILSSHAVIGSGPLRFGRDPGRTGQELSAINRIQAIYQQHGFRTASGEGGRAFGLEHYPKAFYVAWRYRYRRELGLNKVTLAQLAREEGIDPPFAEHIWKCLNETALTFPKSEIAAAWQKLPLTGGPRRLARGRADCQQLAQQLKDWQITFAENTGDAEMAMVLTDTSFRPALTNSFRVRLAWPAGTRRAAFEIATLPVGARKTVNPAILWRQPALRFRQAGANLNQVNSGRNRRAPTPLRQVLSEATPAGLRFDQAGVHSNDFVTLGAVRVPVEFLIPTGAVQAEFTVDLELDLQRGDDVVVRCMLIHDLTEGATAAANGSFSALLANPNGSRVASLKSGVADFARSFPQISHREAAPADRDPIPAPFDNGYNHPERNEFHYQIKYYRDDRFLTENILDQATRAALDEAWTDLVTAFDYHQTYLQFVSRKYQIDLGERTIGNLDRPWLNALPDEPRRFIVALQEQHAVAQEKLRAAEPGQVADALRFAERAWRRPLTQPEAARLRAFYGELRKDSQMDHAQAIRMTLARVLVAPAFLYRVEHPEPGSSVRMAANRKGSAAPTPKAARAHSGHPPEALASVPVVALSAWDLASRLSYFLWSSIPDAELIRAASSGELTEPDQLTHQAQRMLRDPKARRFAAEFFGQWFGFYRFDGYGGVDTARFTEFTDRLKTAMYEEAVSFFDYVVRQDQPVRELLFADYSFLNQDLARHYEIPGGNLPTNSFTKIDGLGSFHRGGLLRLGAVLTSTSAPLRTSAVKRGDWLLRRVLGQSIPPPPGDAGSIPPDDLLADGKTVRQRLEAHRRDASCVNCHSRFDPFGFALEHFDSLGRWRETYRDGQPIDASGTLSDGTRISEYEGLMQYLRENESWFNRTLCAKLLGYALGRAELVSDRPLLQRMTNGLHHDSRFSTLIAQIVASPQFRLRRQLDPASSVTQASAAADGLPRSINPK